MAFTQSEFLAWWDQDTGVYPEVDLSGNGLDLPVRNNVSLATGNAPDGGNSNYFPARTDVLERAAVPAFDMGSGITVFCWGQVETALSLPTVITHWQTSAVRHFVVRIRPLTPAFEVVCWDTGNSSDTIRTGTPVTGVWYCIAYVISANLRSLYVDGSFLDSNTSARTFKTDAAALNIGNQRNLATGNGLQGWAGPTAILNRVADQSDVDQFYNSGNMIRWADVPGDVVAVPGRNRLTGGMRELAGGMTG